MGERRLYRVALAEAAPSQHYLHMENSMLEQGAAQPEWHSAMRIKACTRDGFFWIVNRWFRQDHGGRHQMHVEQGFLMFFLSAACRDCKFHGNLTAHAMEAKRRKSRFVSLSLSAYICVCVTVCVCVCDPSVFVSVVAAALAAAAIAEAALAGPALAAAGIVATRLAPAAFAAAALAWLAHMFFVLGWSLLVM